MADAESDDLRGWKSFDEVASFIEGIERQYGVANENFTEYVVDRLELFIRSCTVISDRFAAVTVESLSEDDRSVVLELPIERSGIDDRATRHVESMARVWKRS
jgi:hypothetical protein